MNVRTQVVKYSIFGDYDCFENTPENVSTLYRIFGGRGFMPDTFTLLKVERPVYDLYVSDRLQLINKSVNCTISFLPERIDIEIKSDIEIQQIIGYFDDLVKQLKLNINRIALNKSSIVTELGSDVMERLKDRLTPPKNHDDVEDNVIEYSSRRVNRIKFDCLGELININRNITAKSSLIDNRKVWENLQIDTDINTLGENSRYRFDIEKCKSFFHTALEYDEKILGKVMSIINVQ